MVEQQLIDYIKKAKDAGQQDFQTKSLLLKNGWSDSEINEAFSAISATGQPSVTPQVRHQSQQSPTQSQQTISQPQPQQPMSQPQQNSQIAQQKFYSTQQPSASMQRSGIGAGRLLLAVFTIIIAFSILGGGGLAYILYSGVYNPAWNPFKISRETIFSDMIANMENVKSYRLETTGKITLVNKNSGTQTILDMSSQSDANLMNEAEPRINSLFAAYSASGINIPFASINANAITIGKDVYVKFNEWTVPEEQLSNFEELTGQWFKFDQGSLDFLQTNQETQIEPTIELINGTNLLPESFANFRSWFSNESRLEDAVVDGKEVYRYSGIINKNNLILEIWIGKDDSMLYGYKFKKTLNSGITFDVASRIYDFNVPVDIIEPENFQKIEETIQPTIKLQTVKNNLHKIRTVAQESQKKSESFAELCYRGLLNGYLEGSGDYLIELNNEIVAQEAKKPVCFSSVDSFCVSAELPDGTFACIDKNGIIGTTRCISSATECK